MVYCVHWGMHCTFYSTIADIPSSLWNELFDSKNPFVQHAFLLALEQSGCVGGDTGWAPRHMLLANDDGPIAVMPLYYKTDSYGEFVFDWGWAEAYSRHGLDYYPKLVTAIPYSPVAGPRLGLAATADPVEVVTALLHAIHQLADQQSCSGWHLLFAGRRLQNTLVELKDEDDLEDDAVVLQGKEGYNPTVLDLDDTENDRTVIAHTEFNTSET